jgi:hypothetical protein
MNRTDALSYYRHITYNHSRWNELVPVNVSYRGKRYHGYLESRTSPYRVRLVQQIENGRFRFMPERRVELDDLTGVDFIHQGHAAE